CHDLQVPVIPLRSARRHPYLIGQTAAGRRCVAEGWIYAPKVPIGSAVRPRIHSASGGPEAPSANPRMAVAARASQRRAFHCASRAGSGTAERARAPLFALTPLIGAKVPVLGSAARCGRMEWSRVPGVGVMGWLRTGVRTAAASSTFLQPVAEASGGGAVNPSAPGGGHVIQENVCACCRHYS